MALHPWRAVHCLQMQGTQIHDTPVPYLAPCTAAEWALMYCAGLQHDFSAALGTYPPAQASHQAVVADRQVFMRTLRQLHDQLGTQFRIPMVSGRELDIHLLYKQVLQLTLNGHPVWKCFRSSKILCQTFLCCC